VTSAALQRPCNVDSRSAQCRAFDELRRTKCLYRCGTGRAETRGGATAREVELGIGQRLRSYYARPRRITRQRCRLQIPITGQNPLGHLIDAEAWNGVLCASRDRANRQGKRQEPAQHRGTQTLRQST